MWRHNIWLALAMALAIAACCGGEARAWAALLDSPQLAARVDAYVAPYVAAHDFAGVVLIAQGDAILAAKAYGLAGARSQTANRLDTAFRVASLSKTFTAGAIDLLVKQGKVRPEDPLSRFLPEFPGGEKISVSQLLLHRSGVGQLNDPALIRSCVPTAALVKRIAQAPPRFAPGAGDEYSNEGYVLLAAVIEKASGLGYEEFLKREILDPLGMKRTGVMCDSWPDVPHARGAHAGLGAGVAPLPYEEAGWNGPGSVYSTAGDLLLWLRALAGDRLFAFSKLTYPYGWGRRDYSGRKLVEQSGQLEGWNAHVALYPQEKLYLVFLSNIQSGMFNRLPRDFEALAFGGAVSTPPVAREVESTSREPSSYPGTYKTAEMPVPLHVVFKDGRLWMRWGEADFLRPLSFTARDEAFLRAEYATVHFQRNATGKVTGSVWKWGAGGALTLARDHE